MKYVKVSMFPDNTVFYGLVSASDFVALFSWSAALTASSSKSSSSTWVISTPSSSEP